jgi:parallel beta-helix repeat protein
MISNRKSKTVNLIILGILFTFLPIFITSFSFIIGNSNKSLDYSDDFTLNKDNLKISVISGKIHIDGNSGWAAFKAAGNCTGNGTYSVPYVIEDLVIDGGGSGSCILIENSDVYFVIENCTVYNSGEDPDSGILLSRVNNSQLIGNTASNNGEYGICLYFSDYNNVSGNTASDNGNEGIKLINSNYNIVSGNIANDNDDGGIGLSESDYNTVTGSTARYNDGYGIALASDSNNNNISGNTASNNGGYGILLLESDYNTISGNTANYNEYGIYLEFSCDNVIIDNILLNNTIADYYEDDYCEDGNGDEEQPIPGYNLFLLIGILSVVAIIISKRVKKS